jgi:hypothetical protein
MTRDEPARSVGHPNLFLAGDFQSPSQVMAADALDDQQKSDVLTAWRRDLMNSGGWDRHRELLTNIDDLLARLGNATPPRDS